MALWIVYYERTRDPLLASSAHLLLFSQVGHIKWYFAFGIYNPGLVQTILINIPVSVFAMRTIYRDHYIYADVEKSAGSGGDLAAHYAGVFVADAASQWRRDIIGNLPVCGYCGWSFRG